MIGDDLSFRGWASTIACCLLLVGSGACRDDGEDGGSGDDGTSDELGTSDGTSSEDGSSDTTGGATDGGSGSTGDASGSTAGTGDTEPQPGQIFVIAEDLVDLEGLVLLVFAYDAPPTAPLGAFCEAIDESPDSMSGPIQTIEAEDNPCMLDEPITFPPGTYELQAGTYVPGETAPEQCASAVAEVDGDVEVTLPPLGDCP